MGAGEPQSDGARGQAEQAQRREGVDLQRLPAGRPQRPGEPDAAPGQHLDQRRRQHRHPLVEEIALRTKVRSEVKDKNAAAEAIQAIDRASAQERLKVASGYYADLKKLEEEYLKIAQRNRQQIAQNDKTVQDQLSRSRAVQEEIASRKLPPAEQVIQKQVQARDLLHQLSWADEPKPVPVANPAVRLSETPGDVRSRAPQLGEHTESILAELGYSAQQIAEFRRQAVI